MLVLPRWRLASKAFMIASPADPSFHFPNLTYNITLSLYNNIKSLRPTKNHNPDKFQLIGRGSLESASEGRRFFESLILLEFFLISQQVSAQIAFRLYFMNSSGIYPQHIPLKDSLGAPAQSRFLDSTLWWKKKKQTFFKNAKRSFSTLFSPFLLPI